MKKKIIIDLDVVTVALWDSKGKNTELAKKFLSRVEKKEFYLGTPFLIIEIVLKWKHEQEKCFSLDFVRFCKFNSYDCFLSLFFAMVSC